MTPRVLVTRPRAQAVHTAEKLVALGYEPVLAPMLEIVPVHPPEPVDLGGVQAVLITSANALTAFAALTTERSVPLLAVGDRTAETARRLGFHDVTSAGGDGAALLKLAMRLTAGQGGVLHPRGVEAAVSFEALTAAGFDFHEIVVYDAVQTAELPQDVMAAPISAALVYSARSGEALAQALEKAQIAGSSLTVIGISGAALAPVERIGARCIAAQDPNETSLFEALTRTIPAYKEK